MKRAPTIAGVVVNAILVVAYPVAVFWGLTHLGARQVSVLLLALLVPALAWRFRRADRATFWSVVRLPIAILCLVLGAIATDDARVLLALPVLVNAVLLVEFASTLRSGATPMIERFARMQEPALDARQIAHCRRWTVAWSAFFVVNGTVAAVLALAAPLWCWTVYTGAIAYVLMGLVFAAEYLSRPRRSG